MAGRRSLVRKDLRWHAEESATARLSRGITDQLGKSLETRPFAVQRPAMLQDRHRNPVRSQAYRREATRNRPTYTRLELHRASVGGDCRQVFVRPQRTGRRLLRLQGRSMPCAGPSLERCGYKIPLALYLHWDETVVLTQEGRLATHNVHRIAKDRRHRAASGGGLHRRNSARYRMIGWNAVAAVVPSLALAS